MIIESWKLKKLVTATAFFRSLLEALSDPNHEEHGHMKSWVGRPFDPKRASPPVVAGSRGFLSGLGERAGHETCFAQSGEQAFWSLRCGRKGAAQI
ncbi:MAG TPA: hypothetical protein VKS22_01640 [Candidatus Binataceae bacterium]|nr:hypothetical protein [Candidatus Binataceae bacterium]